MKINIKDVFEKDERDVRIQTNERLDVDELFAEARGGPPSPQEVIQLDESEFSGELIKSAGETVTAESLAAAAQGEYEAQPPQTEPVEQPAAELAVKSSHGRFDEEPVQAEPVDSVRIAPTTDLNKSASTADSNPAEPELSDTRPAEQIKMEDNSREHVQQKGDSAERIQLKGNSPERAKIGFKPAEPDNSEPARRKYASLGVIAASFVILVAALFIYNNMIPREVYATINGEEISFTSKAHTVENFLEENDIEFGREDYISKPLTTYVYDGIELKIEHATDFSVTADGKTKKYSSLENTVGDALKDQGIKVGDKDIVEPAADELLTKNMKIVVKRVEVKEETAEETVPFETVTRDDSSIDEGTTKVVTEGTDGKDKVTYSVTYTDGVETSRTELSRTTVTAAVDKVIANGTRINFDGQSYSRKLTVKAYSYTGGGTTAMGTRARVGEIAVDPSVIPLGTEVYIEGVGARRAEDTGGNIKGNTIDIYMDTQGQCINWGVRYVTIYIK